MTKDFAFKPYNGFYFPLSSLSSVEDLAGKILRVNGEDSKALGLTASALLPTKDYYQRFPEAFRCFFNNQSLRNSIQFGILSEIRYSIFQGVFNVFGGFYLQFYTMLITEFIESGPFFSIFAQNESVLVDFKGEIA